MSVAIIVTDRCSKALTDYLKYLQPDLDIPVWPNITHAKQVEYAVLWKHPAGLLATFPKLKAVTSLGAGIDFISSDPDLPKNVTVH